MFLSGFMALPMVYAQEKSPMKQEGKEKGFHKIFDQLDLSEDQKKQLGTNKEQQREKMKAVFEQMKSQKDALKQELMKSQLDMNRINAVQSQLKTNMGQMADNRLNSILEVRKVLTPEQFSKFLALMEEHRSQWKSKRDKGADHDEEPK